MPEFRVGDKVRYEYNGQMYIGTICQLHNDEGLYSVEFGPEVPFASALHDCEGAVPSDMGWWIGEPSLTLVRRYEVTWPPKESRRKYKGFERCTQLKS